MFSKFEQTCKEVVKLKTSTFTESETSQEAPHPYVGLVRELRKW